MGYLYNPSLVTTGVDYSTVSQGRKRLKEKLTKDKNLSLLMEMIEKKLPI